MLYRYAHAYDAGDIDAAVACFLPDGVMRVSLRSEPVTGHEQLTRFFTAAERPVGTRTRNPAIWSATCSWKSARTARRLGPVHT